jgi:sugar lactone lactonase YvrE
LAIRPPVVAIALAALLAGCQLQFSGLGLANSGVPIGNAGSDLTATSPLGVPLHGVVKDALGKPVADARVLVFPVTTSSPVTTTSPVTVTSPVTTTSPYRVSQNTPVRIHISDGKDTFKAADGTSPFDLRTDKNGVFTLTTDKTGLFNVEAFTDDRLKAWKGGLRLEKGVSVDAGTLQLAATGTISGRVKTTSPLVTNLSEVTVYIPGSRYIAITDDAGGFTLAGVPAGSFDLRGFSTALGRGEVQVTVDPDQKADALLTLSASPPELTRVALAGSANPIDHAAPGSELDIAGKDLGIDRGAAVQVAFSGAAPVAATAVSASLLRVKVPADARSGVVKVLVGNIPSNALPFRILASLELGYDKLTIADGGACFAFGRTLRALDTDGKPVPEPSVSWQTLAGDGSMASSAAVSEQGVVTASAAMAFTVKVSAGSLADSATVTALGPTGQGDCKLSFPPGVSTLAGSAETPAGQKPADGAGPAATFNDPTGLAVDAAGNLYVADVANHAIRRINRDGIVSTFAGGTKGYGDGDLATTQFQFPTGIALTTGGVAFVADTYSHRIRRIAGGQVETFAGEMAGFGGGFADGIGSAARFARPTGIAVGPDGSVYIADKDNNAIRKITASGAVTTLAGTSSAGFADGAGTAARFDKPSGLALESSGNLFVADRNNNRIRKVAPDGTTTTFAGTGVGAFADGTAGGAKFYNPTGLAFDAAGNLLVADKSNRRIRQIAPDGSVTTVAGTGTAGSTDGPLATAQLRSPVGIAVGPDGLIFVSDEADDRIRVIRR